MFCHDRVSSGDYYLPRRHYPRIKQDPVDIILSGSVLNYIPVSSLDNSLPLSRDVPSSRKEDATIVYLKRTNRPLVCTYISRVCLGGGGEGLGNSSTTLTLRFSLQEYPDSLMLSSAKIHVHRVA